MAIQTLPAETFTSFVRDAEPRLRQALVARYGPERGREATAEALAYGWEHWDRVGQMHNPAGYLYRVGQSRGRLRRGVVRLPPPPHYSDPVVEPALPRALARLSGRQRTAVILVHGFAWTQEEVADFMEVSVSTVRNHLRRGMDKLRDTIGGGP